MLRSQESERVFMSKIKDWGKKVVVVVNKADLLMTSNGAAPGDLEKVLGFVRSAAADALAISVRAFHSMRIFPAC